RQGRRVLGHPPRPLRLGRLPVVTVLVGSGDGTPLGDGEFHAVIKVRGEHTGGAMAVLEQTVPPGRLIVPHTHENDVWVYVLTGQVGVLVGDEVVTAGPGEWALKPRDVLHAMWNASSTPARIIEALTPARSERRFEEIA